MYETLSLTAVHCVQTTSASTHASRELLTSWKSNAYGGMQKNIPLQYIIAQVLSSKNIGIQIFQCMSNCDFASACWRWNSLRYWITTSSFLPAASGNRLTSAIYTWAVRLRVCSCKSSFPYFVMLNYLFMYSIGLTPATNFSQRDCEDRMNLSRKNKYIHSQSILKQIFASLCPP